MSQRAIDQPTDHVFSADEFRALFEDAADGFLVADRRGTIRDANAAIEALFGYERAELLGEPVEKLVPETAREVHRAHRRVYSKTPSARAMDTGVELRGLRRDGSSFPVEIALTPVHTRDGDDYVVASVRSVLERRRLRAFGAQLITAAEQERARIARDLHDDTLQRTSSLLLRLHLIRRAEDAERREALLSDAYDDVRVIAESLRNIVRGLRPPELDHKGLARAVEEHLRSVAPDSDLRLELLKDDDLEEYLAGDVKLTLYRILQEALSNVAHHAEASHVRVQIGRNEDAVRALVEDDGCGFDDTIDPRGFGIVGMRERAAMVGGMVSVETAPGSGTRVEVELPASP